MDMKFKRQLPPPQELKEQFPIAPEHHGIKKERDQTVKDILSGRDERLLLLIGPCSADREDAVLEYLTRLRAVQEQVKNEIFIVPRVYSTKPRTIGVGYKGMLHQPDPNKQPNLLQGIISVREMNIRILCETGFTCADEMLYPEHFFYFSDMLSYVAVGARSVENQQHRMAASGLGIAVGMKNPTSGNTAVMLNAILAARSPQSFIYRDWEVETAGNPWAHSILRGYENRQGVSMPNYYYEDLRCLMDAYHKRGLEPSGAIIDCNHANSGKQYLEQIRISKDVIHSRNTSRDVHDFVRGLMIESYLEDGCQMEHEQQYGKSITDPCLGWEKTEKLIYELAELW